MTKKTILAIGGHIGDMELTAGALMATNALLGGTNVTLALTAGERGNPPHLTQEEYRKQKINEANEFAKMMNGYAIVFDYKDGELPNDEKVRREVVEIILKVKPDIIVTHWHSKMHKDHNATHYIVQDAQFMASVVGNIQKEHHYARLYFCENWEDDHDFDPYISVDVTSGYELWCEGLKKHWFVMNSKDFKYYDYYTSLARCRGALKKLMYAESFDIFPYQKALVKEDL